MWFWYPHHNDNNDNIPDTCVCVQIKQLFRRLNLKYNIATKKLVQRLEFPDEHVADTPGRVSEDIEELVTCSLILWTISCLGILNVSYLLMLKKLDLRLAEAAETNEKWKIILKPEEIKAVENDFRCSKVMKFGGYEFYDFDYDYFAQL